jgi:glycosyltransferase involved in cell wall biosynthesis
MKVAITYDWLNQFGGAERVLTELHGMYPDAPIYTTVFAPDRLPDEMRDWDVRPSFLQRIPYARYRHQPFFPLMPMAFEQFDLREYGLVLTTSSACAKGVITAPETLNICYCYTPCRYLWDLYHDYTQTTRAKALFAPIAHWMRVWDQLAAQRVDHFIAISHEVARRIQRHYRRDSEVIHPPVDVERFRPNGEAPEDYYLVVSRLVAYKRIDLAIEAANMLKRRLIVVGDGPERKRLESLAGPTVELRGSLSDEAIADLYAGCRAFLFPGFEDFGIAPVEAQAAGRPVIAYGRGGVLDTVIPGGTGLFFEEQSAVALARAITEFEQLRFDSLRCRRNAERFGRAHFTHRLSEAIAHQLEVAHGSPRQRWAAT